VPATRVDCTRDRNSALTDIAAHAPFLLVVRSVAVNRVGNKKRKSDVGSQYKAAWRELWQACANTGDSQLMAALEAFRRCAVAVYLRPQPRDVVKGWPATLRDQLEPYEPTHPRRRVKATT